MRYIIMADGKGSRWNNFGDTPKHLLNIRGESILHRTVRLLRETDPDGEILITSHDPRYEVTGAARYEPLENILEIDRFTRELIDDQVCFLYGDTCYTEEAIRLIVEASDKTLLFFGNEKYIFGIKIAQGDVFLSHYLKVRELFLSKQIEKAIGWQIYLSYIGAPLDKIQLGRSFVMINDDTTGFNSPQDYLEFLMSDSDSLAKATNPLMGRFRKRFSNLTILIQALPLIGRGFTVSQAKRWIRFKQSDLRTENGIPYRQKRQYHKMGFLSSTGKHFGVHNENYTQFISMKDYMYAFPINYKYGKWIHNKLTCFSILKPFHPFFPAHYFHVFKRDGNPRVKPLSIGLPGDSYEDVLDLLKSHGPLYCMQTNRNYTWTLDYKQGVCSIDDKPCSESQLENFLFQEGKHFLLAGIPDYDPNYLNPRTLKPYTIRLIVINKTDEDPQISDAYIVLENKSDKIRSNELQSTETSTLDAKETGDLDSLEHVRVCANLNLADGSYDGCTGLIGNQYIDFDRLQGSEKDFRGHIPGWSSIQDTVLKICRFIPQAEFFGIDFHLTRDGFVIHRLLTQPSYPILRPFSKALTEYLIDKTAQKKASYRSMGARLYRIAKKIKLRMRAWFLTTVYFKGLVNATGRIGKRFRNLTILVQVLPMTARGFTVSQAKRWIRFKKSDLRTENGIPYRQKRQYHKMGFLSSTGKHFGVCKENYTQFVSMKDYMYVFPINQKYGKWIYDKLTYYYILKPFHSYFSAHYFHVSQRDGNPRVIPLSTEFKGDSYEDVLDLLKSHGPLYCMQTNRNYTWTLDYKQGVCSIDGKPCSESQLENFLFRAGKHFLLVGIPDYDPNYLNPKTLKPYTIRLIVTNTTGEAPEISDAYIVLENKSDKIRSNELQSTETSTLDAKETGDLDSLELVRVCANINLADGSYDGCTGLIGNQYIDFNRLQGSEKDFRGHIPGWSSIQDTVLKICRFIPQAEFFGIDFHLTSDGFVIHRLLNQPPYPILRPFSKALTEYLIDKTAQKKASYRSKGARLSRGAKKIKLRTRAWFAATFFPKGLIPYLSITWIRDVMVDMFTSRECSISEKIWSYRRGYLSYRIPQYGITKDNLSNHISDFEYKWLRHINCMYRTWMEDKITFKYIVSGHKECFPAYYYYTTAKDGANKIIPMMDCPPCYGNTTEDVFRLLSDVKTLALKPVAGSHGKGFYRLSMTDEGYWLNGEQSTKDQVMSILQDPANQYLITEYIAMHPQFKEIYDGSVNTIRMIVFKKDGIHPVLGNAYMRFGSKKTGAVDNMGAGGMFAKIDIASGKYYDAKIIERNAIIPCPRHPDTDVLIEGIIPNWDKVKELVLQVASSIPELEFFGFDLAVTENGIKFPEINRFPDYPKIETLSPATLDYLLYKLEVKKKVYGYDKQLPKRLINLPDRSKY